MARLSATELQEYNERGYVTPDFRLGSHLLEQISSHHAELIKRHPQYFNYCPTLLAYDTFFLEIARHPDILEMVAQVIGEDFALWNSSFFAKPARGGHATPWHQDGEYWPIQPLATCTVWIAIDASTLENGCLQVIPESHKEQRLKSHSNNDAEDLTLNLEIDSHEYDKAKAEPIILQPGQLSLHDVYLVHGSEANHSDDPRRGMTLRYMPTSSLFNREKARELSQQFDMTDHSKRTLYLMGGRDLSGGNDFSQKS